MASTVLKAAKRARASSPPPTLLPVAASTLTMGEIGELPEEQEIQPPHLAAVASTSTDEVIEETHEIQEQAATLVIVNSKTHHMDTDDHFIATDLKVEDPDIDISAEQLEGGDSAEDFDGGDISLWQNEVKLLLSKSENRLLISDCFLARLRRMMKRRTGATLKA